MTREYKHKGINYPIVTNTILAQPGKLAFEYGVWLRFLCKFLFYLVKDAPVNLIYVCDYSRMSNVPEENKILFSGFHADAISENVYLYCASKGLATVVQASIDKPALAKAMKLRQEKKITLGQPIGYPKK